MAIRPRPPTTLLPKPSARNGDGSNVHNEILLDLPPKEYELLFPKLEFMRLKTHHVLHEPGDTLKSAYFCNSGLVSILSVFQDGKSVEVALLGKEGFVGLPLVVGFQTASTRAVAQIAGSAYRMDGKALMKILPHCPELQRGLQRFAQMVSMQTRQLSACNRLHEVNERLARWLLMSDDRIGPKDMLVTQDLLAQTLGTRRSSVTVAAGRLQKAGVINSTRGDVRIIDRPRLEKAACECYGVMQRRIKDWQRDTR